MVSFIYINELYEILIYLRFGHIDYKRNFIHLRVIIFLPVTLTIGRFYGLDFFLFIISSIITFLRCISTVSA
jgi:hypothetical protein